MRRATWVRSLEKERCGLRTLHFGQPHRFLLGIRPFAVAAERDDRFEFLILLVGQLVLRMLLLDELGVGFQPICTFGGDRGSQRSDELPAIRRNCGGLLHPASETAASSSKASGFV